MVDRTWAVALFAMMGLLLAGCSDPSKKADEVQASFEQYELDATETTGILRGVVFDDGIRPIQEVVVVAVGAEGANLTMTTGADGTFGFDGLEPGTYFVSASKPGFGAQQASADVVAGVSDPDIVKIMLQRDPNTGPRVEVQQFTGFLECSVRPGPLALACGQYVPGDKPDDIERRYDVTETPGWIQSELLWKSTQDLGKELSLVNLCLVGDHCPAGQITIVRSEGVSPRVVTMDSALAEQWSIGTGDQYILRVFVFGRSDLDFYDEGTVDDAQEPVTGKPCLDWSGVLFPAGTCIRSTGPGFVLNQAFEIYTHIFYGFTPDDGWQFSTHGAPKVPEA